MGRNFLAAIMSLVLAVSMVPVAVAPAVAEEASSNPADAAITSPALNYDAVYGSFYDHALMVNKLGETDDGQNILQGDIVNSQGQVTLSTTVKKASGGSPPEAYNSDTYFDFTDVDKEYGYVVVTNVATGKKGLYSLDGEEVLACEYDAVKVMCVSSGSALFAIGGSETESGVSLVSLNLETNVTVTASLEGAFIWSSGLGQTGDCFSVGIPEETSDHGSSSDACYYRIDTLQQASYFDVVYKQIESTAPDGTEFVVAQRRDGSVTVDSGSGPVTLTQDGRLTGFTEYSTKSDYFVSVLDGVILVNDYTESSDEYSHKTKAFSYKGELIHDFGTNSDFGSDSAGYLSVGFLGSGSRYLVESGERDNRSLSIMDQDGNELFTESLGYVYYKNGFGRGVSASLAGSYFATFSFVNGDCNVYDSDGNLVYSDNLVDGMNGFGLTQINNCYRLVWGSAEDAFQGGDGSSSINTYFDSEFNPIAAPEGTQELIALKRPSKRVNYTGNYSWYYGGTSSEVSALLDSHLNPMTVGDVALASQNSCADINALGFVNRTSFGGNFSYSTDYGGTDTQAYKAVNAEGKWGLITWGGNVVLPFEYDQFCGLFYSGYDEEVTPACNTTLVKKDGAWYFLDLEKLPVVSEFSSAPDAVPGADTTRLSGEGRYDTMQAVVDAEVSQGTISTIYLTSGQKFPDALASAGLASADGGVIALTAPDSLSSQAEAVIDAAGSSVEVVIVGGEATVSSAVADQVKALVGDANVSRVSGASRTDTAVELYHAAVEWGSTAVIASGYNSADSLSVSSYAYAQNAPIFLAEENGTLSDATRAAITEGGFTNVVVVGGTRWISDEVVSSLGATRIAGENRYETSAKIAKAGIAAGMSTAGMVVASGEEGKYPDALAGGSLAGRYNAVMLLVSNDNANNSFAAAFFAQHEVYASQTYLLGGEGTLSADTAAYLKGLMK